MITYINKFIKTYENENTIVSYRSDLLEFSKFVEADMLRLTTETLITYRDSLKELSGATVNRRFSSIRSFCNWAVFNDLLKKNPVVGIKLPKIKVENPTMAFTDVEIKAVMAYADSNNFFGNMHKLLPVLMGFLGLRRSEVCAIKLKDIYKSRNHTVIRIRGKGGKFRELPLGEELLQAIESYKNNYENMTKLSLYDDDFLIQSSPLRKNRKPMHASSVNRSLKKLVKECGIDKRISSHSFRATVISHLLEKGISPRHVADFAGHASVNTTINNYDKKRDGLDNSAAYEVGF